jgi:tetratricopeptide (TPR) repeat protein
MKTLYKTFLFITLLLTASAVFAQEESQEESDAAQGVGFYNQGDYQKAVESLQKATAANVENVESWLFLGMSLARLKKEPEAIKALKRADKIFSRKTLSPSEQIGIKILEKPRPSYNDNARMNNTQGDVKLAVEFGADGKIKGVFPFQKLPNGLTENAVSVSKQIKFQPAVGKDGKPVTKISIVSYSFRIY